MKLNEKWTLFLIATFTTFFGITNNFIKGTDAMPDDDFEDVVINMDNYGLTDIMISNGKIQFNADIFMYDVKVEELDDLEIIPVLSNDNVNYTMDIIGNSNLNTSLIAIITVNSDFNDGMVYTLYIEEI